MCDYSLHCFKTRLANEGEQLFVHKFYTGSKGLASIVDLKVLEEPQPPHAGTSVWSRILHWLISKMMLIIAGPNHALPAVCIPPGARLHLNGIPRRLQIQYGVGANEDVTFAQLSTEAFQYRDAVRFRNGQEVLLQHLNEGLKVSVVSLALAEDEAITTFAAMAPAAMS